MKKRHDRQNSIYHLKKTNMEHSSSLQQSTQHQERNPGNANETTVSTSSRKIIMRHLSNFLQDNDLEAVVSDYTDESILITQDATYRGTQDIRAFFDGLIKHFPRQQSSFELDKLVVNNDLAYIVWHADTPSLDVSYGTDTFIIKAGKIYQQTFAAQLKFKPRLL
jgi:hypothetical protein